MAVLKFGRVSLGLVGLMEVAVDVGLAGVVDIISSVTGLETLVVESGSHVFAESSRLKVHNGTYCSLLRNHTNNRNLVLMKKDIKNLPGFSCCFAY